MADQLDLRDLRYFEAIADAGHVGRAARSLHRTQPALTGAIRRLEARLGTALFERAGRGIRLTAAGEALHVRAQTLRIAAQEAVREVADIGHGHAGLVRIGMVPTAAQYLMPPLCRQLLKSAPGLTFKTLVANDPVLRAALAAGDLDLVVNLTAVGDEETASHVIFRDECVVVAHRAHPIFRKKATMRGLLAYGWLMGSPALATRAWLDHAFRAKGLPSPTVRIETNQVGMIRSLLEGTELLSFMSRRHVSARGPLKEVALRETTMRREFAVEYRKGSYLSPAAVRVIDVLKAGGRRMFEAG